jgi:proteic killer suppression protein
MLDTAARHSHWRFCVAPMMEWADGSGFPVSNTTHVCRSQALDFPGLDRELAVRRLNMLDSAVSLREISPLKSVGLHKLKGDRKGQWAISVNGPWRICFRFHDGNAYVELTDYHRG